MWGRGESWREGKESEKIERWAVGKVEMRESARGCWREGHVAVQISRQRGFWVQRLRRWEVEEEVEAKVGPSRRVRMWDWMISEWRAVMVVAEFVELAMDKYCHKMNDEYSNWCV